MIRARTIRLHRDQLSLQVLTAAQVEALDRIAIPQFAPDQFGLFGVEDKMILVTQGRLEQKKDTRKLVQGLGALVPAMTGRFGRFLSVKVHFDAKRNLEVARGVFRTPAEEFRFDRIYKETLEENSAKLGLRPLYSGMEFFGSARSYGHHVHFSAGNPFRTLLLYLHMRNEMWRVVALSANSPRFGQDGKVVRMNDRLAKTFVTETVSSGTGIYEGRIAGLAKRNFPSKRYPLLVHKDNGTLEVRASDLDPRSSATVAYIVLLCRLYASADPAETPVLCRTIAADNIQAARLGGVSQRKITVCREGKLVETTVKRELYRQYCQELSPLIEKLNQETAGAFLPAVLQREIEERIIRGRTPAQRRIRLYRESRKRGLEHEQALFRIQQENFFTPETYFPDAGTRSGSGPNAEVCHA